MPASPPRSERLPFGRLIAWSSTGAVFAANFMILGYVTFYATDVLLLEPAVVGLLLAISKVVDAVGVVLAGWFVDRAPETRWGKARPFELSVIGLWVCTALLFSTPGGLGETARYAWLFVTYLLVTALFVPLLTANDPLYLARAFGHRDLITTVQARSGIVTGVFAVGTAITLPLVIDAIDRDLGGWSVLAWCLAVPMTLFGLLRFLVIRERYQTEDTTKPRVRIADVVVVLRSNPYLWAVSGISAIGAVLGNFSVGAYYFQYILGSLSLQSLVGAMNLLLLPVLVVLPRIVRRFGIATVVAVSSLLGTVGYVLFSFGGSGGPPVLIAALLLSATGAFPIGFLLPVLIIDNATYNEWKGNRRLESVGGAINGFAMNLGAAVAVGVAGVVLSATGYDGAAQQQSDRAELGIIGLQSWLPAGLSLIVFCLALGYRRFERRLPEISAELEVRRAEEAARTGSVIPFTAPSAVIDRTPQTDTDPPAGKADRDEPTRGAPEHDEE